MIDAAPDGEMPEAYRTGRGRFMGIDLHLQPGVLVPRAETELLGWAAVRFLENSGGTARSVRVIDVCCGSGNLACGIAQALPNAQVWAIDLTDPCVEVTRRNVAEQGLDDRVRVLQGDLFGPLVGQGLERNMDAVVCNPPYIPTRTLAGRTDLRHEPREAFDGGPFGLSILMRVLKEAHGFLVPGGGLFVEVGPREESHARQLVERVGLYENIEVNRDSDGVVRFVHGRKAL